MPILRAFSRFLKRDFEINTGVQPPYHKKSLSLLAILAGNAELSKLFPSKLFDAIN